MNRFLKYMSTAVLVGGVIPSVSHSISKYSPVENWSKDLRISEIELIEELEIDTASWYFYGVDEIECEGYVDQLKIVSVAKDNQNQVVQMSVQYSAYQYAEHYCGSAQFSCTAELKWSDTKDSSPDTTHGWIVVNNTKCEIR